MRQFHYLNNLFRSFTLFLVLPLYLMATMGLLSSNLLLIHRAAFQSYARIAELPDLTVFNFSEEEFNGLDWTVKGRENLGLIRKRECDFLLFQLLDAILDNYFETLDQINHEVAIVEKETMLNPEQATLLLIEKNKKNVGKIKKSLLPFKEALTNIIKDRTHFINRKHRKYFRDLKNSCANAIEEANATYAALESLTNIYFSSLSQKMNETMKVLTTVATIFIPLTFIAGIYGMNFANMPELKWKYGYYVIWGIMLTVLAGMVIYFKRKKWL